MKKRDYALIEAERYEISWKNWKGLFCSDPGSYRSKSPSPWVADFASSLRPRYKTGKLLDVGCGN